MTNKTKNRRHRIAQDEAETSGLLQQARSRATRVVARTEDVVRHNPASSALVTFTVGCGLGVMVGLLLAAPHRRPLTGGWLHWASGDQLKRAVEQFVPAAVCNYLSRGHR